MAYTRDLSRQERRYIFQGGDWTFPSDWQTQSVISKNVSLTRSGTSNPLWRSQVSRGVNAATSYSTQWWNITSQSPCDAKVTFLYPKFPSDPARKVPCTAWAKASGPWHFTGVFPLMSSAPDPSNYPSARNQALKFLYQRHADLTHAFQGGVFAGELRQTWNMLKSPLAGLRRGILGYLDDVQNRLARDRGFIQRLPKKRRTKWVNDAIADSWLTATLGFLPLCKDIDDAFKALTNLHDRSETFGLTASGSAESLTYSSVYPVSVNSYIDVIVSERQIAKTSVRFKAGFRFSPAQIDERRSLAGQLSLTFEDFVPTVWNLIPGSFLWDYVTNIGDVLDAYAHPFVGLSYIVESVKNETTRDIQTSLDISKIRQNLGASFMGAGGGTGSATAVAGSLSRSVPSLLMPTLECSLNLTDRQLLNVAALLQKGNLVRLASLGLIK